MPDEGPGTHEMWKEDLGCAETPHLHKCCNPRRLETKNDLQ